MLEPRSRHGVAMIRRTLHVCGGFGENWKLHSAERSDPKLGNWERLPTMKFSRTLHVVVAFHGTLYVFGGSTYDDDTEAAPVDCYDDSPPTECYDASHDMWTPRSDMTCSRKGAGAGVILLARMGSHRDEWCDRGPSPRRRRLNSSFTLG